MTIHPDRYSPRTLGRIAGWLYLYTIVTGLFAEFYVAGLVNVSGNARATAANLLASETLFRVAAVNEMLGVAAYVAVSVLLYRLLKDTGRNLAIASVLFATAGNVVWTVGAAYQFGALRMLHASAQLSAFSAGQVQELAVQSLRLHDTALNVGMLFFGIYCILIGVLMFRSTRFPRTIAVLMAAGGAFDLFNLVTAFGAPAISAALPDFLSIPGFIGEAALTVWLIAVGTTGELRHG